MKTDNKLRLYLSTIVNLLIPVPFAMTGILWLTILMFWFCGWQITYIWKIEKYMALNGISDMKESNAKHQRHANRLLLKLMYLWPVVFIQKGLR